jgi:signal transduction histidine kinase
VAALERLARQVADRCGLRLDLRLPERSVRYAPPIEQQMYQVAVEATANVARHARASRLQFELRRDGDGLLLVVADDGVGFAPEQIEQSGHYGIKGMRERALLIGGAITVQSSPGMGTSLTLWVPIAERLP